MMASTVKNDIDRLRRGNIVINVNKANSVETLLPTTPENDQF